MSNFFINELEDEEERYGRNKKLSINKSIILGGDYKKKFDLISSNAELNKTLYKCSKEMLLHRTGSPYEDMYWIDFETGEVLYKVLDAHVLLKDSDIKSGIPYTKGIQTFLKNNKKHLITLHNHPNSLPPSYNDFICNYDYDYDLGIIACHNGKVYLYRTIASFTQTLYELYLSKYTEFDDFTAQSLVIQDLIQASLIEFKEVVL